MAEENSKLKERVRAFWQEHPCGTRFADAPQCSRRFYELVEAHRYEKEWHIPTAAGFAETKNPHPYSKSVAQMAARWGWHLWVYATKG